ncbi:MAG TPA: hypothetical protein VGZ91_02525 [Candidatus Sulfotelmatobacter sp.]|jgi:hypothetical protein|nr:hypothetical protein [Candidatus Sulfotelmatobacter sp.]
MKMLRRSALLGFTCVVCRLVLGSMMLGSIVVGSVMVDSINAQTGEAPETELKTTAVAAFKNGLAFVVRQGDARLEGSMGNLAPVPNATLGSLWIAPNDAGASLDQVVAHRYKVAGHHSLTVMADVLLANAGKIVTIVDNNQKEYTGEIVGVPQEEKSSAGSTQLPNPSLEISYVNSAPVAQPRAVPEYLLLKSEGKLLAFYFHNVARVILPPDPILRQSHEEERKALRFKIKGATGHANLTMGYLEHGLGWTPSYLISLQDDKTAQVTMQAVLVNDAEDLKDTDLFFVVGVPNFAYANVPSPMALQQSLMEFMQSAGRRNDANGLYPNALTGQMTAGGSIGGLISADAEAPSFASTIEELQGAQDEDLFLYSRKNVTLARGERATYNVFSDTVNYEHIYEWNLEEKPRVDGFGNAQNNANAAADRSTKENVWHTLRLKNTTKFPWTSAPTMVISGTKPLSQDTVAYTPKGATSSLKLTVAADIRASHEENEIDRQKDLERRRSRNYDQVTVEGTLTIKNYKSKDVRLSIADRVRGSVESQTDDGKATKLAEAIAVDNPLSRLTWEITLKAGEERIIKYRYKVWLRV